MELGIYQIDAFAGAVFQGNPAAIVPLEKWLPDETLQAVALENNLSETAYFIPHEDGAPGHYHLRWFTPAMEVDLCGHATLASAYVLFEMLGETSDALTFETRSGALTVEKGHDGWLSMDFPVWRPERAKASDHEAMLLTSALCTEVKEVLGFQYYGLVEVPSPEVLREIEVTGALVSALGDLPYWGLIVTTRGEGDYDFISRFFAPEKGVSEDPVTGSAHCVLTPYWADKLGKTELLGYQASARGGAVKCRLEGDRVRLSGRAVPYLKGTITI